MQRATGGWEPGPGSQDFGGSLACKQFQDTKICIFLCVSVLDRNTKASHPLCLAQRPWQNGRLDECLPICFDVKHHFICLSEWEETASSRALEERVFFLV